MLGDKYALITTYQFGASKLATTQLHYEIVAEGVPASTLAIAQGLAYDHGQDLLDFLNDGAFITEHRIQSVGRIPPIGAVAGAIGIGQGNRTPSAASIAPQNVAAIITKRTAFLGRKYRGRIFLPFLADSDIADTQDLNATPYGALVTLAGRLSSNVTTATTSTYWPVGMTMVPILWHASTQTSTPISQMVANEYIASQRRRMETRW